MKTHSLTQTRTYVKTFQINRNSCENGFPNWNKGMKQKKTRPHAGERVSALEFKFANYRTLMWKRISTFFLAKSSGIWRILRLFFFPISVFRCDDLRVQKSIAIMCELTGFSPVRLHTQQKKNNYRFKIDCDWHSLELVERLKRLYWFRYFFQSCDYILISTWIF